MADDAPDGTDEGFNSFEAMAAGMIGGIGPDTIGSIAAQMPGFADRAAPYDPVKLAAAFGMLLTLPEFQPNCLRLEALVHVALALGDGGRKPNEAFISEGFAEIGSTSIGRLEDPPEDVFVGTVRSRHGNFRILDGIWEGAAFYTQRFLEVVDTMPADGEFAQLQGPVLALLKLSEAMCGRRGLQRHDLGADVGQASVSRRTAEGIIRRRSPLRFSPEELAEFGIEAEDLDVFVLDPASRKALLDDMFGNSLLDRKPLVRVGEDLILVLPTAISTAVRYLVLDAMGAMGRLGGFLRNFATNYERWISETPLLGGSIGAPVQFAPGAFGATAELVVEVDTGRYLHLIFVTDNLRDFLETGIAGFDPNSDGRGPKIFGSMLAAHDFAVRQDGFTSGMTLVVGCGVGRGTGLAFDGAVPENWHIDLLSAYDLDTLSWTKKFKPTTLFKILEARQALADAGLQIVNVNGLVNLVAWAQSLDGHLVPHGQIPQDFIAPGVMSTVMVNQNSLRELRHQAAVAYDPRVEQTVDGRWLRVRLNDLSIFEDDQSAPLYGSEDPNEVGRPMSVYLAPARAWWADVRTTDAASADRAYERWRMVAVWLSRAAPLLNGIEGLPPGPILWRAEFDGDLGIFDGRKLDYDAARASIEIEVDRPSSTLITRASSEFNQALFHPENIAERALVDAMIEGIDQLTGWTLGPEQRAALLAQIVPNPQARNSHAFYSKAFREEVRSEFSARVVLVESWDDALLRLGLGWRRREKSEGDTIEGKAECTGYLNSCVGVVIDDLIRDLQQFNRSACIRAALENHEAAAKDRDSWHRTASAVLALHENREDTLQGFADHEFELNAVFQGARAVVEVANCVCPIDGGETPGAMDLARLMARAGLIFQLGGWSDAIHWEAMAPMVKVTTLGDVFANLDFVDEVIAPHARAGNDVRVAHSAERYAARLEAPDVQESVQDHLPADFLIAWAEQFGATLDQLRLFLDFLDDLGRASDALVVKVRRSAFDGVVVDDHALPANIAANILAALSSMPTGSWDVCPPGYDGRDRRLWRFRRRLSVLRRPIIRLDDGEEPEFMVAPGLMREAATYQLAGYYQGDFPAEQLTPLMRAWKAAEEGRRGTVFANEVAAELLAAGWRTEVEVPMTKLVARALDRDYGDVDVLAWREDSGRVLVIECKDVQYRKTYGEVAEQLADFRGELRPNGKPDYLMRHLDRMAIVQQNLDQIQRYVGSAQRVQAESHLVFKNPVPMEFALKRMSNVVEVRNFSQLHTL